MATLEIHDGRNQVRRVRISREAPGDVRVRPDVRRPASTGSGVSRSTAGSAGRRAGSRPTRRPRSPGSRSTASRSSPRASTRATRSGSAPVRIFLLSTRGRRPRPRREDRGPAETSARPSSGSPPGPPKLGPPPPSSTGWRWPPPRWRGPRPRATTPDRPRQARSKRIKYGQQAPGRRGPSRADLVGKPESRIGVADAEVRRSKSAEIPALDPGRSGPAASSGADLAGDAPLGSTGPRATTGSSPRRWSSACSTAFVVLVGFSVDPLALRSPGPTPSGNTPSRSRTWSSGDFRNAMARTSTRFLEANPEDDRSANKAAVSTGPWPGSASTPGPSAPRGATRSRRRRR